MPNKLSDESSAYLLQHKDNPVDWYPWGPEAFERARVENKPLLISIGYSSCHWCHVMERESFEDEGTARVMNALLVCVKVDREERPDVDQIYMETVVRLTGSGGWPLNVFCTPDGRPFYGGTYYPPDRAYGRPSWTEVVKALAQAWQEQPDKVEEQARQIVDALRARPDAGADAPPRPPGVADLTRLCSQLMQGADAQHGGFGHAPKFPTPTNLDAILLAGQLHAATPGAVDHVQTTLKRMARGGIYDQLGGGFHRYSTDEAWAVPHFEKMLYDEGQLLRTYAEAYRQSGDEEFVWPLEETIDFLEREMSDADGSFYASLDADSEGEEGLFYVWSPEEVADVLGPGDGTAFCEAYGFVRGGNFEATGKTVLAHALAGPRPRFADARARLLDARAGRTRPDTDRKRIAAWIGYAIGGLATAGAVCDRRDWIERAARAADFVLRELRDSDPTRVAGSLLRIHDGKTARVPAFLDDHASVLAALLDLSRAQGDDRYVPQALEIASAIRGRFTEPETGQVFFVANDGEALVVRAESDADGATPAAGGLAALGLARIGFLCERDDLLETARAIVARYGPPAARQPIAFPTLLRAAAVLEHGGGLGLILGDPTATETRALAARARRLLGPDDAVVVANPAAPPDWLGAGWLEGRSPVDGRPTAYVCRGLACSLPATDPDALSLP